MEDQCIPALSRIRFSMEKPRTYILMEIWAIQIALDVLSRFTFSRSLNNRCIFCCTNLLGIKVEHKNGLMVRCKPLPCINLFVSQLLSIENYQIWLFWNTLSSQIIFCLVWMLVGWTMITKTSIFFNSTVNLEMKKFTPSTYGVIIKIACQCLLVKTTFSKWPWKRYWNGTQ